MQTVVELPIFTKQAEEIFSDDEKREVIDYLAGNPLAGDEIPGTGGVRKVRFAAQGKGKSKGSRVIYYWYNEDVPIYAMLAYPKGKKTDLKPGEKKAVAAFAQAIKSAHRR